MDPGCICIHLLKLCIDAFISYRVAKTHRIPYLDLVTFRKRALQLVVLWQKVTCKLRHPTGLRHPVPSRCSSTSTAAMPLYNIWCVIQIQYLYHKSYIIYTTERIIHAYALYMYPFLSLIITYFHLLSCGIYILIYRLSSSWWYSDTYIQYIYTHIQCMNTRCICIHLLSSCIDMSTRYHRRHIRTTWYVYNVYAYIVYTCRYVVYMYLNVTIELQLEIDDRVANIYVLLWRIRYPPYKIRGGYDS